MPSSATAIAPSHAGAAGARAGLNPATRTPSSRTGPAGRVLLEQAQRNRRRLPDVAGGLTEGMRPRDRREVVEADLDPDCPSAALVGDEAGAQLRGHRAQRCAQPCVIVDVVVERPLARLGDDLARRADDAVVLEACAASQLEAE